MARIWCSIGSNIDRQHYVCAAISALREHFGALILSPVYETEAIGFNAQPFYNLVAGFDSELPALQVHQIFRQIEDQNGRQRQPNKFSSRTLDLDLLTWGDEVIRQESLQLPRDEIERYAFVLKPLADVAPQQCHPLSGLSFAQMWQDSRMQEQKLRVIELDCSQ
ncbi:MAG: 2-amino-4-hydroxy-6-hydroxymethyldihydropteridine diphosphokinase [gamma proteobacterium symbiont of Bathyaustriella thionipta]|nr:2-amino-4-hydroxy-6-hydroxymethyldihydropteridine diphosphokinase [gamma proteobacterium symbiont of Bathyaustriella thionipta]